MGKLTKLKKWTKRSSGATRRAELAAKRAEQAAERVEHELRQVRTLLADQRTPKPELVPDAAERPPFYTAPVEGGSTPPAAQVKSQLRQ
ncbi:MAG: hypothetical protein JO100_00320 [Pseudonocardia sp.]|nr:hypothetical protein [Pseudonocardia sp.]